MNKIDTKAIEEHIRGILTALGDDPDREGLKETPHRVAMMYSEVFEGMNYTNEEIAEIMELAGGSPDVAVIIEACHSCMTARGIKKPSAKTSTMTLRGRFKDDMALQNRLMMQLRS